MAEYANMPLPWVYELDIFTFWALLHDVIVYNHSQTKKGREWLQNAWRLNQTEPDEAAIQRKIREGGSTRSGSKNH